VLFVKIKKLKHSISFSLGIPQIAVIK